MIQLVFMVEEPSMANVLEIIVPKIITDPDVFFKVIVFEGKQDLEKQFVRRMKGWLNTDARFMIIRDKDSGDCMQIKENLLKLAQDIDKPKLVRIICHELETFFIGDLQAVEQSQITKKKVAQLQQKSKYRDPDSLANAKQEFKKICKEYQPIAGSRAISPYLDIDNNLSHSFNVLVSGIKTLAN